MLKFEHPKNQSNIIKVIGVGGGGNNAVTHMATEGIKGVDFIICNTDAQALEKSPVPNKVHLGKRNLGAGNIPSVGRDAALESVDEIKELLENHTKMLFITAGMGGGTGTGAAPIVAEIARELDILTVGIVTIPFLFEGKKRRQQALEGIDELRKYVDTLLIISNDKLREEYGNMRITEAFKKADDVLAIAARGIAELITVTGYINVDFEDVKTVMKNSGKAIMGSAKAEGEDRAINAIEDAMRSPLLSDSNIAGARNILLYITSGTEEVSLDEVHEITDYIQQNCGNTAELIWGNGTDETLGKNIGITVIATGFAVEEDIPVGSMPQRAVRKNYPLYPNQQNAAKASESAEQQTEAPNEPEAKPEEKPKLESLRFHDEDIEIKETPAPPPATVNPRPAIIHQLFSEEEKPAKKTVEEQSGIVSRKIEASQEREQHTTEQLFSFETPYTQPVKPEPMQRTDIRPDEDPVDKDEMDKKSAERQNRLKELSMKLKTQEGLNQLEQQPAYMRKGVKLSENEEGSAISRYSIDGNDNKPGLRSDNSFLHDNVD